MKKSRRVFLFLDYDGTLTPIVSRPEDANLPVRVKRSIKTLAGSQKFSVAVISGRSLVDIRKKVGVKNIIYAGNHGLELEYETGRVKRHVPLSLRPLLEDLKLCLNSSLRGIKGAIVEDKGPALSVHFRTVAPEKRKTVKHRFMKILRPYVSSSVLRVTSGKMVLEVRPAVEWDKGRAVLTLLAKKKALPVYLGDDLTDNDAFRALKGRGISIFVGNPKKGMGADYYLKDTREVEKFLEQAVDIVTNT